MRRGDFRRPSILFQLIDGGFVIGGFHTDGKCFFRTGCPVCVGECVWGGNATKT